jgi:hypothetical protein
VVLSVVLPVVNVDVWQTRNQKLKLLLIEDRDELSRDDVMEACISDQSLFATVK